MAKYHRIVTGYSTLPGKDGGYSKEDRVTWVEDEDEAEAEALARWQAMEAARGWYWTGSSWMYLDGTD